MCRLCNQNRWRTCCLNTHQVEWERLCALAAQRRLQQLLGQNAQHQQGHQSHGDAEAQQSQEAALTASSSVRSTGLPVRVEGRGYSLKASRTDDSMHFPFICTGLRLQLGWTGINETVDKFYFYFICIFIYFLLVFLFFFFRVCYFCVFLCCSFSF